MSASYDLQGSFDHVALFASWTSVHIFASLVRIETAVTFRIYTACYSPSQYVTVFAFFALFIKPNLVCCRLTCTSAFPSCLITLRVSPTVHLRDLAHGCSAAAV